jgi:hypothetical protein
VKEEVMGAFTNRPTTTIPTKDQSSVQRFSSEALSRYESIAALPEISIPEGAESRTEYQAVPQERGMIARMFLGDPPPKMVPVRITSSAVERSNDAMAVARNRFALRDQLRDEERKIEEHLLGKGERTVKLLGVELNVRRAEFAIELELEQQRSDRETYAVKREIDRLTVDRQRLLVEGDHVDSEVALERKRQELAKVRAETVKLFGRLQTPTGPTDEPISIDEVEALARRATLAAVTGSVAPTTKDRWVYPFAGTVFLAFFVDQQNLNAAQEHTFEAMCDLYTQMRQGRFHLTLDKAEKEYVHYRELRERAEQSGAIGALKDLMKDVTRGGGGKHAFRDDLNA